MSPEVPARGETVPQLPRELYLEITNRCNLKCHTCPQDFGMPEPFRDLGVDEVRELIAPLDRLDRVVLHGIGESLMHRHVAEIVEVVKAKGAYVLFNTNGTLLKPRKAEQLIRAGLDELRVSLDAATESTYVAVRGEALLPTILRRLHEVSAIKRRLGRENPRLSLWMTGLRTNVGELPALVRLAAELGIAEVYLQRVVTSSRGLAILGQSLYGRAEVAAKALQEAEQVAMELGVQLKGAGATTGVESVVRAKDEAPWRGCRRPWSLMYVTANRNVLPCCIAPFTATPYEAITLGEVRTQPLSAVWNGEGYRRWRTAMLEGEPPEACRRCGTDWSL